MLSGNRLQAGLNEFYFGLLPHRGDRRNNIAAILQAVRRQIDVYPTEDPWGACILAEIPHHVTVFGLPPDLGDAAISGGLALLWWGVDENFCRLACGTLHDSLCQSRALCKTLYEAYIVDLGFVEAEYDDNGSYATDRQPV